MAPAAILQQAWRVPWNGFQESNAVPVPISYCEIVMARKAAKKKVASPKKAVKKKAASPKKAAKKKTTSKKVVKKKDDPKKEAEKAPKKKKKATKRKKKSDEPIRLRAFWGVFSQTLKQVALFEYHQKKQALDKAATLSKSGKPPHFVKIVKEPIEEEV